MAGAKTLTQDDDIDVGGIFTALRRKWWLIAILSIFVGAIFLVGLSSVEPRYNSSARILIRDGDNAFTRSSRDQSAQLNPSRFDQAAIRSFVEVINSDGLATKVINDLELTNIREFKKNTGLLDLLTGLFGMGDASTKDAGPEVHALKAYRERLKVFSVAQTRVIVIEFWSHDASLAQDVVRTLSESYIARLKEQGIESSASASNVLDPRVKELERNIVQTETAVAEFRSSSDILLTNNNNSLLATEQLSQTSSELSRVRTERVSAEAKVNTIRAALDSGSSLEIVPDVIQSSLIQRLREREVEIKAQISDLSTSLLPNHPRMKALQSQLIDFQNQILRAAKNIVKSLENNVELARKTEADLEKRIVKLKAEAARVDEKMVELRALEREAEAAKILLADYKNRSLEAKTRSGISNIDAEIISPASLSLKPFFPKVIPIAIAGAIGTAVVTSLIIIGISLLTAVSGMQTSTSARRRSRFDRAEGEEPFMEANAGTRQRSKDSSFGLGIGPRGGNSHQRNQHASFDLQEPSINVEQALSIIQQNGAGRIIVFSPGSSDACLDTLAFARALHSQGEDVLLVDLSDKNTCAAQALGKSRKLGLFNLISGTSTLPESIYQDKATGLSVMVAGEFAPNQSTSPEQIEAVLNSIDGTYEIVIFECGNAEASDIEMIDDDTAVVFVNVSNCSSVQAQALFDDLTSFGIDDAIALEGTQRLDRAA